MTTFNDLLNDLAQIIRDEHKKKPLGLSDNQVAEIAQKFFDDHFLYTAKVNVDNFSKRVNMDLKEYGPNDESELSQSIERLIERYLGE